MSRIEIEETILPGVGVRHDFQTEAHRRLGVLRHHSGRMDLLVYDDIDPDVCRNSIPMTEDEGHTLGELLGVPQVVKSVNKLQQTIGGLAIDWIEIVDDWACSNRRIDSLKLTDTGVLIVAVIRDGETIPIPKADFELHAKDTVVVIGMPPGIKRAYKIMQGSN